MKIELKDKSYFEDKYITVLDFEDGRVYQYKSEMCDFEEFIDQQGHNLSNCQWMIHNTNEPSVVKRYTIM